MTTQSIFRAVFVLVIVAFLSTSSAIAQGSNLNTATNSGRTAESVREQLKTEREARKAAFEQFKAAEKEQNTTLKLASIQNLANKLITERERALVRANIKSAEVRCVSAKADITSAINVIIANLSSKKAEVAAATTVEAVKAIIKDGIIGKNHVFVAVLPALRGMCASNSIIELVDGRLAILVTKLKDANLDTTTIEEYLTDAKTNAQGAYDAYKVVANNPGSATYKTDLETAKTKLKAAKASLSQAKDEAEILSDQHSATTDDSDGESTN